MVPDLAMENDPLYPLSSHAGLSTRGEKKGGNSFLEISGLISVVLLYLSDPSHFHMLFTGESYLTELVWLMR